MQGKKTITFYFLRDNCLSRAEQLSRKFFKANFFTDPFLERFRFAYIYIRYSVGSGTFLQSCTKKKENAGLNTVVQSGIFAFAVW